MGEAHAGPYGWDGDGDRSCAGRCPSDSVGVPGRLGEVDTVTRWRALVVLGTALIGSLLIGSLAHAFTTHVEDDVRLSQEARQQVGVTLEAGVTFVPTEQVRSAATRAGLPPSEVDAVADSYASAQLDGLKAAILATGGITLAGFLVTPHPPGRRAERPRQAESGMPVGPPRPAR